MIRLFFILITLNAHIAYAVADDLPIQDDIVTEEEAIIKTPAVGIRIGSLQKISPNTIGLLNPSNGGLGYNIWQGTSTAKAEFLLSKLPANSKFATVRELQRKLLLSESEAPTGQGQLDNLISLKLIKLMEMGEYKSVSKFIDLIPPSLLSEDISKIKVSALFAAKSDKESCDYIASQEYITVFWSKYKIICNLLDGELDKAELNVSLLAEKDEKFAVAVSKILTDSYKKKSKAVQPADIKELFADANYVPEQLQLKANSELNVSKQIIDVLKQSQNQAISQEQIEKWQKEISVIQEESKKTAAISKIYAIMDSLGYEIPVGLWGDLLYSAKQPESNLVQHNIKLLSHNKNVAETLALIIIAVGDKDDIDTDLIKAIMNGLVNIGMEEYAVRLATEIKI